MLNRLVKALGQMSGKQILWVYTKKAKNCHEVYQQQFLEHYTDDIVFGVGKLDLYTASVNVCCHICLMPLMGESRERQKNYYADTQRWLKGRY